MRTVCPTSKYFESVFLIEILLLTAAAVKNYKLNEW